MTIKTTAVSTVQLADLAGVDRSFLSLHRDVLPAAHPARDGTRKLCYDLEEVAAFVLERTSFLSDAECRLRVALTPECRRRPKPKIPKAFYLADEVDGLHDLVPILGLNELSPTQREGLDQALITSSATTGKPS